MEDAIEAEVNQPELVPRPLPGSDPCRQALCSVCPAMDYRRTEIEAGRPGRDKFDVVNSRYQILRGSSHSVCVCVCVCGCVTAMRTRSISAHMVSSCVLARQRVSHVYTLFLV